MSHNNGSVCTISSDDQRTHSPHDRQLIVAGDLTHSVGELSTSLPEGGWKIHLASGLKSALELLTTEEWSAGMMSLTGLAPQDAEVWMHHLRAANLKLAWIGLIPQGYLSDSRAVELILSNCYDFHTLPIDLPRLMVTLGHAAGMARLCEHSEPEQTFDREFIGESPVLKRAIACLERFASANAPVLITGETGTGKELAARLVHRLSDHSEGPFVAINCGGIPPTLVQSELFGYQKGAFTGAHHQKLGRIEAADGGTLFLDEVGELPPNVQVSLLRVLQEGLIEPLGATDSVRVNVRIVAATNVDLSQAALDGMFRRDLFYRLSVLSVSLPPLRSRPEDIPLLAGHFLRKFLGEAKRPIHGFSPAALTVMQHFRWPGNVRELINRVRRAIILTDTRFIQPCDLDLEPGDEPAAAHTLQAARDRAERAAIEETLRLTRHCVSDSARLLEISRGTLYNLIRKHKLSGSVTSFRS